MKKERAMLYRLNKNGRYEAVTVDREIFEFEDAAAMKRFAKMRREILGLVGKSEEVEMDSAAAEILAPVTVKDETQIKLSVKIRIFKSKYVVSDGKLIKKALA